MVGVWLILAVAAAPLAGRLKNVTDDRFLSLLPSNSDPVRVNDLVRKLVPGHVNATVIVVYARTGGLTPSDQQAIESQAIHLRALKGVLTTTPPFGPGSQPGLVSANHAVAVTVTPLNSKDQQIAAALTAIRAQLRAQPAGLTVHVTGGDALESDLNQAIGRAGPTLLLVTGVLVLVLLIATYRSPLLAVLPLVVVGLSYAIAAALAYALAKSGVKVTSTSASLLLVLMFGAGTDYCLLVVTRYKQRLTGVPEKEAAAAGAMSMSAPAILASSATVIGAMLTLLAARLATTTTLGPIAALGVFTVLLASLTLFPAILSLTGREGFWPNRSVAYYPERAARAEAEPRQSRWSRATGRLLSVRCWPSRWSSSCSASGRSAGTQDRAENSIIQGIRGQTDSTRGYKTLTSGFSPGALEPATVALYSPTGSVPAGDVPLAQSRLRAIPGVGTVSGVTSRSPSGNLVALSAVFTDNPELAPALARTRVMQRAVNRLPGGVEGLIGGESATLAVYQSGAENDLRTVVPLVLVVILVTLALLLRAIVAPLYLLLSVVLSFFGTLGASLAFFRLVLGKHGFDPNFPLFTFVFLVALGVDYNIFLMDRVRREASRFGTKQGVLRGVRATGPVITSAGLILAGTFASLSTLPVVLLLELGLSVAFGVLVDTFLVRTVFVPAITLLAGDRAWWPSRLKVRPFRAGARGARRAPTRFR